MAVDVVLDGALATELQRRGVPVRAPWWSTAALRGPAGRAVVRRIHEAYVAAGSSVVTANTFRCNLRALARAGLDERGAADLVEAAVGLARAAVAAAPGPRRALVAGSLAPVEDCYRPSEVPPEAELHAEHGWLAERLVAAGADVVLAETMNTAREAVAAVRAVRSAGGRAWASFVCGDGAALLSGEDVGAAAAAVAGEGAELVLVNCATPRRTEAALARLRAVCPTPIGAYPNVEDRSGIAPATPVDRYVPAGFGPAALAELGARWTAAFGLAAVGGCCGTTPAHIAALARTVGPGRYGNLEEPGPAART